MDYIKENFFKWLLYAALGAIAMVAIVFCRDWIANDIGDYEFYATKFYKGFVVFCILAPILDTAILALYDKFGNKDEDYEDEDEEAWYFQGYKNDICVAEVVYRNEMTRGDITHKFTYINKAGEQITRDLFDVATEFTPQGYGQVCINGKYNMIDKEGKYLCDEWYLGMANPDEDGCIKVMNEAHLTNFLDSTGKPMWEKWRREL